MTKGKMRAMIDNSSRAADKGIHQSTIAKTTPDSAMMLIHLALLGSVTKAIAELQKLFAVVGAI